MREIRELREHLGIKQKEMADELGLYRSNYNAIEKGTVVYRRISTLKQSAINFLSLKLDSKIEEVEKELEVLREFKKNIHL